MESRNSRGYVTFADILGWKGIWQFRRQTSPVDSLLKIRRDMNDYIVVMKKKYNGHLIQNELSNFFDDESRRLILAKIKRSSTSIEGIILPFLKTQEEKKAVISELDKYKIDISIELISDTFVITTSGENSAYELFLHALLAQSLIVACLKNGFLIRGATSYGEYYKQELIFVGPAIDDSASWHEMGEEIGIFFTPKALLTIENDDIDIRKFNIKEELLESIMFKCRPEIKTQTYETYMIDWSNGAIGFNKILLEYSTILPDIQKKILFSKKRLVELMEKKVIIDKRKNCKTLSNDELKKLRDILNNMEL